MSCAAGLAIGSRSGGTPVQYAELFIAVASVVSGGVARSGRSGLLSVRTMVTAMRGFDEFVADARPRLQRAFVGSYGVDRAAEATAEALAWGWEHWDQVQLMDNPVGYLFRVGQSRTRPCQRPVLPSPESLGLPEVEPMLVPALLALTVQQRTAVWLVHGCQWRYSEVAEAMHISASAVGTHVQRALHRLRRDFEADNRV